MARKKFEFKRYSYSFERKFTTDLLKGTTWVSNPYSTISVQINSDWNSVLNGTYTITSSDYGTLDSTYTWNVITDGINTYNRVTSLSANG